MAFGFSAHAHTLGLSQGTIVSAEGPRTTITLAFAQGDYAKLGANNVLDAKGAKGAPCATERTAPYPAEDGVAFDVVVTCQEAPASLHFHLGLLLGDRHHLLLRVGDHDVLVDGAHPDVALGRPNEDTARPGRRTRDALALGFEHVALGYDHLLFLLGLALASVVAGERKKRLFLAVTTFTFAHTAALALAFRGGASIPERPVEVLIACTIGFVGFEVRRSPKRGASPLACALFGLVHGLGFGTAFRGALGTTTALTLGLATLGVELAQVTGVGLALGFLALPFMKQDRVRRVLATLLFVVGLLLAAWRAFH